MYIRFLLEEKFTPQNVYKTTEVKSDSITSISKVRDLDEDDELEENTVVDSNIKRAKLSPIEISDYVKNLKSAAVHWYNSFNPWNNSSYKRRESMAGSIE